MFSWIIKMLLKFAKPLIKFAILSGLITTLLDGISDDEDANTEDTTTEE